MTQRLTRSLFLGLAALVLIACSNESNANSNTHSALPPVTDQSGMLRITTKSGDAKIFINGQRKGNSPSQAGQTFAIKLGEGSYVIEARKADGEQHEFIGKREDVFVADGTLQTIHLDLQRQVTAQALAERERRLAEHGRRYRDHGDGTVTDTQTGLMWMRCSIDQQWNGTTCTGEASEHSWAGANAFTNQHRFAGRSDWRLPTVDELETLVYCSSGQRRPSARPNGKYVRETNGECEGDYHQPRINQSAFPNTPQGWYWSSSPYADYASTAWYVSFGDGRVDYLNKRANGRVRLVRAGQ
ncbi:Protein of unknown function [Allopseudospirillum japonicum]|uniref:Lcl C-terminal domain-containing protein n=1 Tax=Allopseudospirillum japonicum TaxID=64971 RepID=A0A1H6QHE1_9GAMM|nr:DUF1566 domain-containing protein [Allopseudospirillum japonicum]SEI38655.1 Protein of unknown function [Allopseudospirillum japonicum]